MTKRGTPRKTLKLSVRATRLGIKVRRVKNASRGESYGHSWLVLVPAKVTGGKRLRKQFTASETKQAVNFAEGAAAKAKQLGQTAFDLTVAEHADAKQALAIIQPLGMSLLDAARYAAKHLRPAGGDITFGKLRDRIMVEKHGENLRKASLQGLSFYFGKLVDHFGGDTLVKTATYDQLREWVDAYAATSGRRHVKNLIRYAKQFFNYARDHAFVGTSPAHNLKEPKLDEKIPVVLTIKEVKRLLKTALLPQHKPIMPAVVISLFCGGMRSAELERMRWEHLDLKRRILTVSSEVSKKRDIRYPEIPAAAVEFLLLHPKRKGPITPPRFRHKLTALHKDAGFARWKSTHANAKRHSFGSYAIKLHDAEWVVDQMGNSIRMLLNHYRNASVTKEQAEEYFSLTLDTIGKLADTVDFAATAATG